MQGGEKWPVLLSPQAQKDVLFYATFCCRAQYINYITPLHYMPQPRNTIPSSRSFFPLFWGNLFTPPNYAGPSKVCLAQARERKMVPAHTKYIGPNAYWLPAGDPKVPALCTEHPSPFQNWAGYRQRCLISLSHIALPDHSGRSFSLPEASSLHYNTTDPFHIERASSLSEEVNHFLLTTLRSTNPT